MASRYFKNTATVWNSANSWSATASTGVDNAGVPTTSDTAFFDANSGNCTVNVSAVCLSIDFTGYANTITMSNPITTTTGGTITLGTTAISVSGASALICTGTTTLASSSGGSWGGLLTFATSNAIKTLTSSNFSVKDLTVGILTRLNGAFNITVTGTLNVNADITFSNGAAIPTIVLAGNSTWTGSNSIGVNLTFNSAGTITISGTVGFGSPTSSRTITYTAGTIVATGSTVNWVNTATTINTPKASMTWGNWNPSVPLTLSANTAINSLITTASVTMTGTGTLDINGDLTLGGTFYPAAAINLTGTGTWTGDYQFAGVTLTINTSGTITISGTVGYGQPGYTSAIAYTTGTVVTTSSTLKFYSSVTMNTTGAVVWNNVTSGTGAGVLNITCSSTFSITGLFTVMQGGNNCTVSGANNFNITGSMSLGSGILTIPNTISITNLTITGLGYTSINGSTFSVNVGGNLTISSTSGLSTSNLTGVVFNGTGTWSHTTTGNLNIPITINTSGTLTISGNVYYSITPLTYTAGTVVTTGSTLNLTGGAMTLNLSNSVILNNLTVTTAGAYTLSSKLNVSGTITIPSGITTFGGSTFFNPTGTITNTGAGSATTLTIPNAINITNLTVSTQNLTVNGNFASTISGNLTVGAILAGTTPLSLTGTGTWSGTGNITSALTINTAGTITLSGTISKSGTLTYTTGTVSYGTSVLTIPASLTFANTAQFNIYSVTVNATATVTINTSNLVCNGTLTLSAATTFAGTAAFSTVGLTCNTASLTHTLVSTKTYTVTSALTLRGTAASNISLIASTGSSAALFNLTPGASQNVSFVTATDINSAGGQTIYDYKPTLTRTTNWSALTVPSTISYTFVN